eukprot:9687573-Alexandrium_andersonii.AAC.1
MQGTCGKYLTSSPRFDVTRTWTSDLPVCQAGKRHASTKSKSPMGGWQAAHPEPNFASQLS